MALLQPILYPPQSAKQLYQQFLKKDTLKDLSISTNI